MQQRRPETDKRPMPNAWANFAAQEQLPRTAGYWPAMIFGVINPM